MWGQSKQATSATVSIIMLTVGALIDVWTVILWIYLARQNSADNTFLWCYGLLATGIVLMVVGLAVGRLGRSAIQAETAATPSQVVVPQANAPAANNVQPMAVPVAQNVPQPPPTAPAFAPPPRTVIPTRPV